MDRSRHVAIWLRMLAEKEIVTARTSYRLLKAQGTKIANAFEEAGQYQALKTVAECQPDWVKVLTATYSITVSDFRIYILEVLGVKKSKLTFLDRSIQWISSQAYLKSAYLTATTHEIVKRVITDGLTNGLSEKEIAKNIKDNFTTVVAANRAQAIARTEVGMAASYGLQTGAEETQLPLTRVWIVVQDERTREDHANADGQERGMDEPFDIGGESLDYPRDPSGSAGNTINCRCSIIYNPSYSSFAGVGGEGDFISGD